MPGSKETRYHEAGHAVGAVKLDVGLQPEGIVIESEFAALTHVREELPVQRIEEWYISRAAVKLAGPAAECRLRCRTFGPDILKSDCHYFQDYNQAQQVLQQFWTKQGAINPNRADEQLCDALRKGHDVIAANWDAVQEVAGALDQQAQLTEEQIRDILGRVAKD